MDHALHWLPDLTKDVTGVPWSPLGDALRSGLPVPNGFAAGPGVPEESVRAAYETLKIRERTHFVAVRGPSHAVLDTIGSDPLIHTMRRLRLEAPDATLLVQRMVHSAWCGKAGWDGETAQRVLRITANEGMLVHDPDVYLFNAATCECTAKTIQQKQRKTIRRVDGISKTIEVQGERMALDSVHLKRIAELVDRVGSGIGWALDDNSRLWLISIHPGS